MSKDAPTIEPRSFIAGATVPWSKSLEDYPAGDGWTLKYSLRGPDASGIDVTATTDGDDYLVTIDSTNSDKAPGTYRMVAWVEKGSEKYYVVDQQIVIQAKLGSGTYESRTKEEIILDSITTALQTSAGTDVVRYQIGDRMVERRRADAIAQHQYFSAIVRQQQRLRRANRGLPFFDTINSQFR